MPQIGQYVSVEAVDTIEGLWCRSCALPSGVHVFFTMAIGPAMSLREMDRCRECGGDQIDPPEA